MNAKLLSILTAASLATPVLMGAAPEPAASPAAPAPAADAKPVVERYQLKKRSVCNIDASTRPPFWPIGWVHRDGPHQEAPTAPKYTFDEKNFAVTSILMGPPAIAVINGRAYEEGQFLRQPKVAPTGASGPAVVPANAPRVRVQRITDGQVWLACDAQILAVPLKRPELNERKGAPELLNEEQDDVAPAPAPAPSVSKR